MQELRNDVLVIGSGGAGLRAAIAAASGGASVTLISKGPFGRSGATIIAGADIMADGSTLASLGYRDKPADSPDDWARDILIEGFNLNDENLVHTYVHGAGPRVRELLEWGMQIRGTEERALITTGVSIAASLRRGLAGLPVTNLSGVTMVDLLTGEGRVLGALGIDYESGELILVRAKAVVLATGGWHQAYSFNAGADELTGDGQGMAYRAGAELVDMEMVTFAPNILLGPPRYRGSLFFYILPGKLLNRDGEEFMAWEDPKVAKLAATTEWNKLLFSKASMREVRAGRGGPRGGVFFSMKHIPDNLFDRLDESYPGWRFQGDDFSALMERMREGYAVEVGPAAEYFEGGIRINERCETSIPGLYAAGECSGGLFGANRVSAATTEMVVEGEIAGREAAKASQDLDFFPIDPSKVEEISARTLQPFVSHNGETPRVAELRQHLCELSYEQVGVLRDGHSLSMALSEIEEIASALDGLSLVTMRRDHNREWTEAMELRNMLQCVELSAHAALTREESRGVHVREDRPFVDNLEWRKHIVVQKGKDSPEFRTDHVVSDSACPPEKISYEDAIVRAAEALAGEVEEDG